MSALLTRRATRAWLLIILALVVGCSRPPQVGTQNYELVAALRTAVSARRTDWLEDAAKVISARHAAGEINEQQFTALEAIVEQGRGGDWQGAESEVMRLAQAQRASSDEDEQSKSRKPRSRKP